MTVDRLRPRSDVRFRRILDEAVVLRQEEGEVLVLNEVGSRILELLDGARTTDQVVAELAAEFDGPPERLERDVLSFVQELVASGVLVGSDGSEEQS